MPQDTTTKILEIQVEYKEALEKIASYRLALEQLKARQAELKKELKEGTITQQEYHKQMESVKLVSNQYNDAAALLTKTVKNQIKMQSEQEGSLTSLRAQLSNLTAEYDRMSQAERNSAAGKELEAKINSVTDAIKGAEEETQRYYRNVGNYSQAMEPLKQQLDEVIEKMQEMKQSGADTSPEFEKMALQAEQLEKRLSETTGNGNVNVRLLARNVTTCAAAFTIWDNASKALGIENQTLSKTISVLLVGITSAVTAMKIYNALQKQSALYNAAAAVKTWILNSALGVKIAATTAETAATTGATAATWLWNAALAANPLVWLATLVAAAVVAVWGLVKAFQWFFRGSEERKKQFQQEAAQLERLHDLNNQAIEMAKARGENETRVRMLEMKALQEEYNAYVRHYDKAKELYKKNSDEFKEARDKMKEAQKSFQEKLDDSLVYLTQISSEYQASEKEKAMGTYRYKKSLIEAEQKAQLAMAKTLLNANRLNMDQYKQMVADINAIAAQGVGELDAEEEKKREEASKEAAERAKERREKARQDREDAIKEAQTAEDAILALMKDGFDKQARQEELTYQRELKSLQERLDAVKGKGETEAMMRRALNDQIYALEQSHAQRMQELEWSEAQRKLSVREELIASELELTQKGTAREESLRREQLAYREQQETDAIQKRIRQGELTADQGGQLIENIQRKYLQKQAELSDEYDKADYQRRSQAIQERLDALNEAAQRMTMLTDEQRTRQLAKLNAHEARMLQAAIDAADAQYQLLLERGQLTSQSESEWQEELKSSYDATMDARSAADKKITENTLRNNQRQVRAYDDLAGAINSLGQTSEAFAKLSKVLSIAEIAIDTGKSISASIKTATETASVWWEIPVAIATCVASVVATMSQATSSVKSAHFATGGKVVGQGTGTSDSVPAMLSNGEFVMTARATKMYEPLLTAMNNIGRGAPMQASSGYERAEDSRMMTDAFAEAARGIKPVVSVVEITKAQQRVSTIQKLDTF